MFTGIIVTSLLYLVFFALLWRQVRFAIPRKPAPRPVVLRPIVIPARYGSHTFTDAEIIDRFLAVDWLLTHRDTPTTQPARDW